jgi:hypothetical protein
MYTRSASFRRNAGSEPVFGGGRAFRRDTVTSPRKRDACRTLAAGDGSTCLVGGEDPHRTTRSRPAVRRSRSGYAALQAVRDQGEVTNRLAERDTSSGFALVCYLGARWTLSSTTSGQDVPGQKSDDDDGRRDSDDGDGGGGYHHAAILARCPMSKPGGERRPSRRDREPKGWAVAIARVALNPASAPSPSCALSRLRVQVDAAWSSRPSRFAPEVASRSRGGPPCQSRHSAVASSRS